MRHFCSALAFLGLKEIHLQNKKFTWSNERHRSALTQIDRFFCNTPWDVTFNEHTLHALFSSHSNHCPLILTRLSGPCQPRPFKFENFWMRLPRFQETVQQAWNLLTPHTEAFHRLGHKLHITAKALRQWSSTLISNAKLKFHMAQIVIQYLDTTQDTRTLSDAEFNIRHKLKKRLLGWAVIERTRTCQCSLINFLQEGDANTRFFHLKVNACRRKNFIQRLRTNAEWTISHQHKHESCNITSLPS
jgi:hypothetical protein